MAKRLSARKLSNPISSGQNIASSSENSFTWTAAAQPSPIGGSGDQVKLYNPNDFLQAENSTHSYPLQQNWPATSQIGAWPDMTSTTSAMNSSVLPTDNKINTLSNGAQNGQADPWAWNTSDTPSPVENSNQLNPKSNDPNSNVPMSTTTGSWDVAHENLYHNYNALHSSIGTTQQQTQQLTTVPPYQYVQQTYTTSESDVWIPNQPLAAYQQQQPHTDAGMWQSDVNNYHWTMPTYQNDAVTTVVSSNVNDSVTTTENLPTMSNVPVETGTDVISESFEVSDSLGSHMERAISEQRDLTSNKEQVAEIIKPDLKVSDTGKSVQGSFSLPPSLSQSTSHLFERTDSWLSGSSLQTVNYSVGGSQDTLDASYYVPPETAEEVRKYMESLSLAQLQSEHEDLSSTDVPDVSAVATENNSVNHEVPLQNEIKESLPLENSFETEISVENIVAYAVGQQNSEATVQVGVVDAPEQNIINDDGVRQPPEGAAAVRPTSIIGAQATTSSNVPAFATSTSTVAQAQFDNSNELANRTPEETENVENLQAYQGAARMFNNKPETYSHASNIFPGVIGIREGSPFKPPPKSTADIASVIQQELPENVTQQPLSLIPDVGANLEMTPDNAERPSDFDHMDENMQRKSKESSPNIHTPMRNIREVSNNSPSTTLWQNPEPLKGNVLLVPATSSAPQQNVLIVPHLSDQQEMLDNPLGSKVNQTHENLSSDNAENVPSVASVAHDDANSNKRKWANNSSTNLHVSPSHSDIIQQELPVSEKRSESIGAEMQPEKTMINTSLSKDVLGHSESHRSNVNNDGDESMSSQGRGQRPPVPGLGPVQPLPRALSEPPEPRSPVDNRQYAERVDRMHEPRRQHNAGDRNYSDDRYEDRERSNREAADNYQRPPYNDRRRPSVGHEDVTGDNRRRRDHSRDRHRHGRDDYDSYRHREDPYYPSGDRDGSRPSSRGSIDYESDHQYHDSRMRDYPPPNRNSRSGYDSDRETYYQKLNPEYRGDPYRREPHYYGDYNYGRYDQNAYYQPYYTDPYYGYNNYNYGYYAELYGSDPRYRQPYTDQQLREYYSRYGYENSDRRSVQSGRSSVNDDLQAERTKYEQGFAQSTPNQSYDPSVTYADYSSQETGYYQQPYAASTDDKQTVARMTPVKFQIPHMKVQFTASGQLIKVLPNSPKDGQPATIEIHDIQSILSGNNELETLKNFPGPLQKGSTHKNDVMQFCTEKHKTTLEDVSEIDRESSALIWELLTLLIRQNGTVVGTDIAELLLKDHEYLVDSATNEKESSPDADAKNLAEANGASGKSVVVQDRSVINKVDEEKVTRKFREYLLFGRKREALEKAMQNGLWGHALFLASKMDSRTYNRVMTRFANSLKLNDPLQTLYQVMSGRQPAVVTCVAEEKWGDWRPHLAMILSNTTNHPEIDHKSITILGDTLATRGCLQAAQFCYLMAGVEFGTYSSKSNKLVLLGANHSLPFNEFATNEAIQCTEVYEYAQSLGNADFILPHFQSYRFIYATRLIEFGFVQEALHYFEVIASHVCKRPTYFHPGLVSHVYELANRLKFFDPHYANTDVEGSEITDPVWLQELRNVVSSYDAGMIQQEKVNSETAYVDNNNTGSMPESTQQANAPVESYYESSVPTNTEMTHSNNNQYLGYQYPEQHDYSQYTYQNASVDPEHLEQEQAQQASSGDDASYQQVVYQSDQHNKFSQYYAEQAVANFTSSQESLRKQSSELSNSPPQAENYWDLTTSKNTATNDVFQTGTEINRKGSVSSNKSSGDKPEKKEKPKQVVSNSANAGWGIGGLISKFLPKPKNQMKLPDDRNPSIIWDENSKRWINTDEDEEDSVAGPVAPPSDSEILKGIPTSSSDGTKPPLNQEHNKFRRPLLKGFRKNYVDVVSKNMTTVSNSGSCPLYPMADAPSINPSQLLIPTAVPGNDNTNSMDADAFTMGSTHMANSASTSAPSLKRNDTGQTELSRSSSQSSLAQEVQHYMAPSLGDSQNVVPQPVPMMFNPSQIPATQNIASMPRLGGQMGRRYPR